MIVRYLPWNSNFFKIACVKSRPLEIQERNHEFPKFAFLSNSHHPPENMAATIDYKEAELSTAKGQFSITLLGSNTEQLKTLSIVSIIS